MVNSAKFSERLQKIMEEYDLNATSFADQIEVGRSSISHILSGRNKPSLEFVMKVIDAFPEVELYWLLNGKGNFPKNEKPSPRTEILKISETEKKSTEETIPNSSSSESAITRSNFSSNGKEINRIVIFYEDGTFESFQSPKA